MDSPQPPVEEVEEVVEEVEVFDGDRQGDHAADSDVVNAVKLWWCYRGDG